MTHADSEGAAIEAVIKQWRQALAANDGALVKSLWDQSYDGLVFIVEENNEAYFDWPSIAAYYDDQTSGANKIEWQVENLRAGVLGDAAWAYLEFHAKGIVPALGSHHFDWFGRNSYVLRRVGGDWKLIHYHESLSRDKSHLAWGWYFEGAKPG